MALFIRLMVIMPYLMRFIYKHMRFKFIFLLHLLVNHQRIITLLFELIVDNLEFAIMIDSMFLGIQPHIVNLNLMFLVLLFSTLLFNLMKYQVFSSIRFERYLQLLFVKTFIVFIFIKVMLINFIQILMNTFFMDLLKFYKIFIILVRLKIIAVFLRLMDLIMQVFIII